MSGTQEPAVTAVSSAPPSEEKDTPSPNSADDSSPPSGPTFFDLAHSRKAHRHSIAHDRHIHGHHEPLSWRHLFKRPVIRQWIAGKVLARESAEREPARFELFFDLVFVGIIHQLADRAAEESSAWAVYKFLVAFWLAWSVWQDVRLFLNTSGSDDIPQRAYVLLVMALLLGFSSNASAVIIECTEGTETAGETTATVGEGEGEAAASEAVHRLFRRAESDMGAVVELGEGCELLEGWAKNVRAALAYYLVAKLPLMTHEEPVLFVALPIVAVGLELWTSFVLPITIKLAHTAPLHRFQSTFYNKGHMHSFVPALNVEHSVSRMNLFIIIVLGEMIINITFAATGTEAGLHYKYLRCVLGLVIAYFLNWIFADADGSRTFLHALRRNYFTANCWQHLHFVLCAALILVSVAIAKFVAENEPTQDMKWIFGGGLGVTMVTLTLLGLLNKPLDVPTSAVLHRNLRLTIRLLTGVIFALLPLSHTLTATHLLAIVVGVLFALCVVETAGKLGAIADEEAVHRALNKRTDASPDGESAPEALARELGGVRLAGVEEGAYELTDLEKGEDDAGVEADLGQIRVVKLTAKQRLAYAF
ncbi:hypothetical protein JCM10207_006582 [Rhodosporidiobolus poonsookiae]